MKPKDIQNLTINSTRELLSQSDAFYRERTGPVLNEFQFENLSLPKEVRDYLDEKERLKSLLPHKWRSPRVLVSFDECLQLYLDIARECKSVDYQGLLVEGLPNKLRVPDVRLPYQARIFRR